MKPLRMAVVGTGHLGRIHAQLAAAREDVELVAVVDPVESARNSVAEQVGAEPLADVAQLAGRIDAAIIATPTSTHHAVAMPLLAQGIHLLIEKPITPSVEQADELVAAAQRSGVVLQVGHVERFNPALERVRPQLEGPKYIEAVRVSGYPFRSTDVGVVLDLMIHDLDIAMWLAGSPVRQVEALGVSIFGQHEDAANCRLVFQNGCTANLTASRVSYRAERTVQVWTPTCFTTVDYALRTTTVVQPCAELLNHQFDLESLTPERRNELKAHLFDELFTKVTVEGAEGNALADEQRDLVESIRSGSAPRVTGGQARDVLAVAERILEAIAHHSWDGTTLGRTGPFAAPAASILRGPHWHLAGRQLEHREAG